jgi:preprotein translocase subunit Sec61beta
MAKLNQQAIRALAKKIIASHPGGIRYTPLTKAIAEPNPETPMNTIHGSVWNLDTIFPGEIIKPSRGLFQSVSAAEADDQLEVKQEVDTPSGKIREQDFYETFAEFLKTDLDEVNHAAALGGAGLKGKWGTPDVIGVYKPQAANLIKFSPELVSAEIKIDPQQPIVAFGQAVAYRLFSHKTYIAMPNSLSEGDQSRLEALCMLFGLGMVIFDLDVKNPNYSIRVRAQRFTPDMFYVNDFADRLRSHNADVFEKLFS